MVLILEGRVVTAGVKTSGRVVVVGDTDIEDGKYDVSGWKNIVSVSVGGWFTVGLKANGTVIATVYKGNREFNYSQCDVSDWKNIRVPQQ